jgi:hypothetical protein
LHPVAAASGVSAVDGIGLDGIGLDGIGLHGSVIDDADARS